MKDIHTCFYHISVSDKIYETRIVASPNKCNVTVQRVYELIEDVKETYYRRYEIKLYK